MDYKQLELTRKMHEFQERLWVWRAQGLVDDFAVQPWPHMCWRHICDVFGYNGRIRMAAGWNSEDQNKLTLLTGPHGYAIYKAMIARMKHDD